MDSVLSDGEREILRQVAADSIRHGVEEGRSLPVSLGDYPEPLREEGAVFVTLKAEGRLRGCVGSTVARRPLVEDVSENAFGAAFRDPRFSPVSEDDLGKLEIHISLLTPPVLIVVEDRQALLGALHPGVHGLLIEDPPRRVTFLPQVWTVLPDPENFLGELFLKGGFPWDHWSDSLRVSLYTVEEF